MFPLLRYQRLRHQLLGCTLTGIFFALTIVAANAAEPAVTLELFTEDGVSITGSQQWSQALGQAGLNRSSGVTVRIRKARSGDEGTIVNRGDERSPHYYVTGFIRADNRLHLPNARPISVRQANSLKEYIANLKADGIEGMAAPKAAFGLTPSQLVDLHKQLSRPTTFDTKGLRSGDAMRQLVAGSPYEVEVSAVARTAFRGSSTVVDELKGVSVGTAMAAVLRPLGLVLVPVRPRGGDIKLVITDSRSAPESWPVGWPSEQPALKTMPKLFEFLNAEIDDYKLSDALAAIAPRLEAPLIFDQNSMARHGVDADTVKVSHPDERVYYKKMLERILAQAKMKMELRVDEAGEPFLWLTTIKR